MKPGTSGLSTSVVTSLSTVVTPSVARSFYSMDNNATSSSLESPQEAALELTTSSTSSASSESELVQQPKPLVSQASVIVHSSTAPVLIPLVSEPQSSGYLHARQEDSRDSEASDTDMPSGKAGQKYLKLICL